MSIDYQTSAIQHADKILADQEGRGRKMSDASSQSSPVLDGPDPCLSYRRSLFQHTNTQYLRAKQRLAKQALRKSRDKQTAEMGELAGIDVKLSKLSTESSTSSTESY